MLNIGTRPTIDHSDKVSVEVHLFDFDEEIYGNELMVSFIQRIRSEKKFDNKEALIAEMEKDKVRVERVLR